MTARNGASTSYAPLSQTNIDSDSEEEIHITHQTINQAIDGNDSHKDSALINGFSNSPIFTAKPKLSTTRKCFFILSIFICFMTAIGFVWILPCNVNPCVADRLAIGAKSWETPLYDLEIHGPIAIVGGNKESRSKNLVLLAKRAVTAPQPLRHQILSLLGIDGNLAWTHMLAREPHDLHCMLLDANLDGIKDCIVTGSQDLLKAVDPLSGMSIWEVGSTSNESISIHTQRPLLLPDITNDTVPDLLTSRSFPKFSHFLLISGATGKVIGKPVTSTICVDIMDLFFENDFSISYTCLDTHKKKSEQTVTLSEIMKLAEWPNWIKLNKTAKLSAADGDDNVPDTSIEAHVAGKRLLVENRGHCPNDCSAVIVIKDNNNHTLYNHTMENVYGMTPVILSFDHLTGFVIKLWQWHGRKGNKRLPNINGEDAHFHWRDIDGVWTEVTERVVLMTFNKTEVTRVIVHVVNVSQQNLVQLCQKCTPIGCDCQPAAQTSRPSHLDGDNSRELISYSSSFVETGQAANDGKSKVIRRLEARVRVVRLQAELPLLYQSLSKP